MITELCKFLKTIELGLARRLSRERHLPNDLSSIPRTYMLEGKS